MLRCITHLERCSFQISEGGNCEGEDLLKQSSWFQLAPITADQSVEDVVPAVLCSGQCTWSQSEFTCNKWRCILRLLLGGETS